MKNFYTLLLISFFFILAGTTTAQVTLSTSPYTENFDNIGSGLPAGFLVTGNATASTLGTAATLTTAKTAWNNTTAGFKNFASSGAPGITSGSPASPDQNNATDRALGVRSTGTFGDPGSAFVFQVTNTTGMTDFTLSFNLQSLDITVTRIATWKVQYGFGSSPTTFYDAPIVTGTLTTGGSTFSNNTVNVDFGSQLDNQNQVVTIRIVTLTATTGSGSRPTTGIDNFSLSWSDVNSSTPRISLTDASNNTVTDLSFPYVAMNTTATQSYILNGKNLTEDVNITATGSAFSVSDDNSTFASSISITPAQAVNKTIYVKFAPTSASAYNGSIANTSTGAKERDIALTGLGYDPAHLVFDFNTCANSGAPGSGFTQYSVVGAQIWACTTFGRGGTNGVNINGYANSTPNDNEDWLISPKLDLSNYADFPVMTFWSRGEFSGPTLTLWASTDYDGTGDPNNFTWTQLNANFPPLNNTWTISNGIDLSAYKSTPVYIAFKYISNGDAGAARWTVDDIDISDKTQIFSATPGLLYFGEQSAGTQSAGKAVSVYSVGYGDVTVTAPANYQVSLDNSTYATSILVPAPAAQSTATIYVRFAPVTKELSLTGNITFTNGTDLNSSDIFVSGTSYPKSETFDAGCYNMSFFGSSGSSAIVRTPEQITDQINNIATVYQHMNLDVAGFEEMSSDASLALMVTQLNSISGQTYATTVSDRYSYFWQAPDPNYPAQKIGFIYNTATMTPSATEPPRAMFKEMYDSILASTKTLPSYPGGSSSSFWASGRLPYMATFTANINGFTKKIRIVVIHAKAGADAASYNRRKYDAQVLKDSLDAYYQNDNVLVVGDYNDRLVGSITVGQAQSSYQPFLADNTHYTPLTYALDLAGQTSFPGDNGMIDQIIISNGLTPAYLAGSTQIEPANTYISPYNKVIASDHLPVYSRFDIQFALPVTISSFTGKAVDASVQLSWTTANELNNNRFLVQRSANGTDFVTIGEVKGAGTSYTTKHYQYTDNNPINGANFYRLVQEDFDGRTSTSGTIRVTFSNNTAAQLEVYPNPIARSGQVTLKLANAAGSYKATLLSITGNVVLQTQGSIENINKSINTELGQLNSGIYLIQLSNGTEKYQTKLFRY